MIFKYIGMIINHAQYNYVLNYFITCFQAAIMAGFGNHGIWLTTNDIISYQVTTTLYIFNYNTG